MTRRVLVCTIGATPQVVTETVWALVRDRDPPWIPDEIEIVTTTFALTHVRAALQASDGPLGRLLGRAPPVTIFVPLSDRGVDVLPPGGPPVDASPLALRDVNSGQDAEIMGDLILRRIARVTADEETELHVSLAGGRKTMSAHALMALSVVGRSRDQASHVLVDPPDFEDHPDFWHPDQGGLIVRREQTRLSPRPAPTLDPATATVVLVPTPTALMRYRVRDPDSLMSLSLAEAVRRANLAEAVRIEPSLVLLTATNEVEICGVRVRLGPKLFALFRLLAEARRESWHDPASGLEPACLTWRWMATGATPRGRPIHARLRSHLVEAVKATGGDPNDDSGRLLKAWDAPAAVRDAERRANWMATQLGPNLTRLVEALEESLGEVAVDGLIHRGKRRSGGAPFSLIVPSRAITIV